VNLVDGKYAIAPKTKGVLDFISQLKDTRGNAELAAPELPYELLRRTAEYEVRRYPALVTADTTYEQRPEGYDRLGSYVGGSNADSRRLQGFSPTIMRIGRGEQRRKVMSWPLAFSSPTREPSAAEFPLPTGGNIAVKQVNPSVVAVARFDVAATEPVVKYVYAIAHDAHHSCFVLIGATR
jgi:hypothetical protein